MHASMMEAAGLRSYKFTTINAQRCDMKRISKAEKKMTDEAKLRREERLVVVSRIEEAQKQKEGTTYQAGGF